MGRAFDALKLVKPMVTGLSYFVQLESIDPLLLPPPLSSSWLFNSGDTILRARLCVSCWPSYARFTLPPRKVISESATKCAVFSLSGEIHRQVKNLSIDARIVP